MTARLGRDHVHRFDSAVDAAFERMRGRRTADLAALGLSNLADYGVGWILVAGAKGRRPGRRRRQAVRALTVAGLGSLTVNAAIKALVERRRPATLALGRELLVRSPSSSSFPSGHTLAAFCAAMLLGESAIETTVFLALATAVAASRIHLRAHHPSDVIGGACIGMVLGCLSRPLARSG